MTTVGLYFGWPEDGDSGSDLVPIKILSESDLISLNSGGYVKLIEPREARRVPWCRKKRLSSPVSAQEFRFVRSHPSNKDVMIYSVFYDPRHDPKRPVLRGIGIAVRGRTRGLFCQMWYRQLPKVMVAVPTGAEVVPEGDDRRYLAVVISCSSPVNEIPYAVSFSWSECARPIGFHPVRVLPSAPVRNGQFGVCMAPLHSFYDNADEIVQTFELNRLFGANRFFVYNYTSGKSVAELLSNKHYAKDVTVLPFHVPVNVDRWPQQSNYTVEVKYFAQMAMLQDCVMRASIELEFVVFTDMDEVIVPRGEGLRNWRDLVRARMSNNEVAGLSIQQVHFWLEWPTDRGISANATISRLKLNSLLKLYRDKEVHLHGSSSKMLVRPHFVRMMGVHFMWRYFNDKETDYVNFRLAGVHHYRSWKDLGHQGSEHVRDPTMLRYREQLVASVLRARTALGLTVR